MDLTEKSAYIKGLIEGMNLDPAKDETKILEAMADLLGDLATGVQNLETVCSENSEVIDELDEGLADVEDIIYRCKHSKCGCCDDDEDVAYKTSCPNCENVIQLDDEMIASGDVICPNCGEKLEFDPGDEMRGTF